MSRATQCQLILSALQSGERLTQLDVLNRFGCLRLAARIDELRATHPIQTDMEQSNGKRYAVYSLERALPPELRGGE